ncbi:hypothetical protein LQ948_09270 [Jiella sp. MQZ9-1]|uniref:AsmA-like C-terminal region n=1 Tax=Jiella flava TaxID=2816857 RepID=A0A939JWZ8_9HYPH|nr:hypothetical protein [Jiella flava]MBO0662841.1 hypothetical protein [Jiella flava]MCD2471398.1 hypothetical protein [Jiella flava]
MNRLGRILAGVLAGALIFCAGAIAIVTTTSFGKTIVLNESQRLAASLLPSDVAIAVGSRRMGFTSFGELGFRFEDVVFTQRKSGKTIASLDTFSIGISLIDLLRGKISADTVAADHVRVDPRIFTSASTLKVPTVEAVFAALDDGVATAGDMPIRALDIRDLRPLDGGTAENAARVDRLMITHSSARDLNLTVRAAVGSTILNAYGQAKLSGDHRHVASLQLATQPLRLPPPGETGAARPETVLALRLDGHKGARRLGVTASFQAPWRDAGSIDSALSIDLKEGMPKPHITATFANGRNFTGAFEGTFDFADAAGGRVPFDLISTKLLSRIGLKQATAAPNTPRAARFAAHGTIDLNSGRLAIDQAALDLGGGRLSASALLTGLAADDRLTATFQATKIAAVDLKAFWPFFVANNPRDWAMDNLVDGTIESANFGLDLTVARLAEVVRPNVPMTDDEFQLHLAFDGGVFHTMSGLPDVSDVSGTIRHRGGHVAINVATATAAGFDNLTVLPSQLDFQDVAGGADGALSLNVEGPAADILTLAAQAPMSAFDVRAWPPNTVAGQAKIGLGVAFHLARSPSPAAKDASLQPKWTIVAELEGVDLKEPINGRQLSDLTGTAMIAEGSAIGELHGKIDGIPAVISFTHPIGTHPVGEENLKIDARLDHAALAKLSPMIARMIGGPLPVEMTLTKAGFAASADLSLSTIHLPEIGWTKSAGIAGRMTFSVVQDGKIMKIENAVIKGEGFSAEGSAELDGNGLKSLVLKSLSLNRGDAISARLTRIQGGVGVRVAASSIDARPLLGSLEKLLRKGEGTSEAGKDRLLIELSAKTLVGFGQEIVDNAEIRYDSRGGEVDSASVTASIHGAPVSFTVISDNGDAPVVHLDVGNAGALLRFAGLYDKMQGGHLKASLGNRDSAYAGTAALTDFSLVDEERLRSLVGTARQSSDSLAARLGKDLPVANAYFDVARARLYWEGGKLQVDDGIVRGPIFGSSFAGTLVDPSGKIAIAGSFMPAYGFNRLFGALPFVGPVLGNGSEGGLIGITYRLEGTLSNPTLIVNPISLIAPGIFRRIFEY